jgi:hypothetical protein
MMIPNITMMIPNITMMIPNITMMIPNKSLECHGPLESASVLEHAAQFAGLQG